MNARISVAALTLLIVTAPFCVAGSGSKAGSGAKAGGSSSRAPSGSSSRDPLSNKVFSYDGELTKGTKDGSEKATISGQFRLRDGQIFAVASPGSGSKPGSDAKPGSGGKKGSDKKSASADRVRATFAAVSTAAGGELIGDYRTGRNGRMTLFFGSESKAASGKKGSDKKGSDQKGSDSKEGAVSATASAAGSELNGVMTLTYRKRRSGESWVGSFREKEGKQTIRTWKMRVTLVDAPGRST